MRPVMAKAIGYLKPDIDPNTLLYVPFNEGVGSVAKDYSQYGNHAQLTDVEWSPDRFNGAGKFNGSSSYGDCGNNASLNITDAITIEAWVKPAVAHASQISFAGFVSKGYHWNIRFFSTTGRPEFYAYDTEGGNFGPIISPDAIPVNQWSRIAATYKYNTTGHLYVNGIEKGSDTAIGKFGTISTALKIGLLDTRYFNGTIDNVIISSTARSAAQIAADCYEVVCS